MPKLQGSKFRPETMKISVSVRNMDEGGAAAQVKSSDWEIGAEKEGIGKTFRPMDRKDTLAYTKFNSLSNTESQPLMYIY